jgi:hypothetical protein
MYASATCMLRCSAAVTCGSRGASALSACAASTRSAAMAWRLCVPMATVSQHACVVTQYLTYRVPAADLAGPSGAY